MKSTIKSIGSKLFLLTFCLFANLYAFAQDEGAASQSSGSTVNQTTSTSTTAPVPSAVWYNSPILWIVGGALVFILILVAIMSSRNSGKTDVTRSTTTVIKD